MFNKKIHKNNDIAPCFSFLTHQNCIKNNRCNINSFGFTLIELLVVVTIIGVLASIALIGYGRYVERAKDVSAINEINNIVKDIRIYMIDSSTPPPTLADVDAKYSNFEDPWGRAYQYASIPVRTIGGNPLNTEFDIYSMGRDGLTALAIEAPESRDDIIRASMNDDEYIGKAERY